MMKSKGGHAAFVIIDVGGETDTRIVLVTDKENSGVLKLPGGTQDDGGTQEETAMREIGEELGVILQPEDLILLREHARETHRLVFFRARSGSVTESEIRPGEEIGEVRISPPDKVVHLIETRMLLPRHADALLEFIVNHAVPSW